MLPPAATVATGARPLCIWPAQLDSTSARHHDALVRTTVTLEPDVAVKVQALAHRRGASFKATLNDLLRRGLGAQQRAERAPAFVVRPHHGGFRPGVDPTRLNQLIDDLEIEDFVDEAARSK